MLQIIEIGDVAWQGKTKPVFCRAEDGNEYIVKGKYAGRKALVAEFMTSHLGQSLGLPIPPFEILEVNPNVLKYGGNREVIDLLGQLPLFGSCRVYNVEEISHTHIKKVDRNLQAKILCFDWWVANGDRIYGEAGGNPNLLWDVSQEKCWVIDHNLAFEPEQMEDFFSNHIFRGSRSLWTNRFRLEMEDFFNQSLDTLQVLWNQLPEEWVDVDIGLDLEKIQSILSKYQSASASFWSLQ
jgi:hypothetical protein